MDVTEEYMTLNDKIAELKHNQNQLRDLNAEMRRWLDVADDDMSALRSENALLKKQVKVLENSISSVQKTEAEFYGSSQANELDVEKCNETKIRRLEQEYILMKEQNVKLTAELKSLQQEGKQHEFILTKFKVAIQTLEKEMQEVQLGLQERDEDINRKYLKLKYLEKTVEELSNFIPELRLVNQELRKQLEDRRDEAAFSADNDLAGETLPCPHLSLAEEISLLDSPPNWTYSNSESTHLRQEENNEEEEQLEPRNLTMKLQTNRFAGMLEKAVYKVFPLCIVIFTLAFMASNSSERNYRLFSINTFWKVARALLQPYCGVHYGDSPPV